MIAPRLQELREQINQLEITRTELEERVNGYGFEEPGVEEIREYMDDLRTLLEEETAFQQKTFLTFLQSFIT